MASAAPKKPLKGILKKPAASRSAPPSELEGDAREIALKHAAIIQDRKDFEAAITESIIRLTELPILRDPPYSSSNPAPSDTAEFKSLVRIFQPTDYDDLIEERNTCGLCGYSLCGNPRKTFAGNGTWKLLNVGRKDFSIVQKKEIEKWCSQDCARRALYIKVQLNETAAWERAGIPDIEIDLLEEQPAEITPESQLARELGKLKLQEERKVAQESAALALERGDTGEAPKRSLVDIDIVENRAPMPPVAPTLESTKASEDATHLMLEGYQSKFSSGTKTQR